ncbi:aminodeoxychorismate synthase component I [Hoeflea prorocentri]|uniref:Aminodeoxychorismate synthase component I n=1 Tax=Hoeflea prorocentri TaxID=1922333 RepID=A0A9X3UDG6_9HYPH|nr:aminodeoxychorismate synthase component I [Hoeflea prorocentri]MCY6379261.1 aminodeoxychorismate synthase component I [Hoeflea prorocentri]MDA5397062.1 aminodeoxychorismate synthase component I [Hoeflea prorocentri]
MDENLILFRNDFTGENLCFSGARSMVTAWEQDEVVPALDNLEQAAKDGLWSAGYIAYEAGIALEPALVSRLAPREDHKRSCPLLCFGLFDTPQPPARAAEILAVPGNNIAVSSAKHRWDFETYESRFDTLRSHLHAGDCFQANLTYEIEADCNGGGTTLFNSLRARQAVAHSALVRLEGPEIVSRSPELFFRVDRDGWIDSKPMKGTAPRGATASQDAALKRQLEQDPKCRSENLMIVDLLRNDLSRICSAGSVHVPELYHVETFSTVHQMISRVRGKLEPGATITDIMRAIFPCGSITGAPKIRAMEIIHALEDTDRNIYCGSIGWIAPSGMMEFNVAIRTISLFPGGKAVLNVGGGIIFDSDAHAEYEECRIKARYALDGAMGQEIAS